MAKIPSAETLFKQASMTASDWLYDAKRYINNVFGDGYAEQHPELVGSFIQAAALDQAGMYLRAIAENLDDLSCSTSNVAEKLDFDNVVTALENIADTLEK